MADGPPGCELIQRVRSYTFPSIADQQLFAVLLAATSFIVKAGAFATVGDGEGETVGDGVADGVGEVFGAGAAPRRTSPGISFSPIATVTALFAFDLIEME